MSACSPETACSRSEEHTSELQSQSNLVCRLLLVNKKTGSLTVSPVKRTVVAETSSPDVPSNIWTTATPPPTSRTWPLRSSPLGVLILASSPYPTPRTDSTKIRGPDISRTVLYSRPASDTILFRLDSGCC